MNIKFVKIVNVFSKKKKRLEFKVAKFKNQILIGILFNKYTANIQGVFYRTVFLGVRIRLKRNVYRRINLFHISNKIED